RATPKRNIGNVGREQSIQETPCHFRNMLFSKAGQFSFAVQARANATITMVIRTRTWKANVVAPYVSLPPDPNSSAENNVGPGMLHPPLIILAAAIAMNSLSLAKQSPWVSAPSPRTGKVVPS